MIPSFQKLMRLKAEFSEVEEILMQLKAKNCNAWIEIELTKTAMNMNVNEQPNAII